MNIYARGKTNFTFFRNIVNKLTLRLADNAHRNKLCHVILHLEVMPDVCDRTAPGGK